MPAPGTPQAAMHLCFTLTAFSEWRYIMAADKKKFIAKAAVLGAAVTAAAAIAAKFIIHKSKRSQTDDETDFIKEEEDDYLDTDDFASIGNDTNREYVSIKINEHAPEN